MKNCLRGSIHDKWDWSRKFPVIKIDFADGVLKNREELDEKIRDLLWTNKHTFTDINQMVFCLGIPNMEVKIILNNQFINAYSKLVNEKLGLQRLIYTQLRSGDVEGLVSTIKRLFTSIPWRNFTNNDLADFERNYAEKYRGELGKSIHEIGLIFSRNQRNLIQADWQ